MRRHLVVLLLLAALPASRAHSQVTGGGAPMLREPTDWGPESAWRRRAAQVRARRMELLSAGNIAALNAIRGGPAFAPSLIVPGAAATAVTGAFRVPVILLAYKDVG